MNNQDIPERHDTLSVARVVWYGSKLCVFIPLVSLEMYICYLLCWRSKRPSPQEKETERERARSSTEQKLLQRFKLGKYIDDASFIRFE